MVNSITAITKHARPIGIQIAKVDDSFRHEIRRCGIHCKMTIFLFVPWLSCRVQSIQVLVWNYKAIKNLWSTSKTTIPLNSESGTERSWMLKLSNNSNFCPFRGDKKTIFGRRKKNSTLYNKLSDVKKTYIVINKWQKFELYVCMLRANKKLWHCSQSWIKLEIRFIKLLV